MNIIIHHSKSFCEGHNFSYQVLEKHLLRACYDQLQLTLMILWLKFDWSVNTNRLWNSEHTTPNLNKKGSGGSNNFNIDEVAVGESFTPLPRTGIRQVRSRLQRKNRVSSSSTSSFRQSFFEKFNDALQNNSIISLIWLV